MKSHSDVAVFGFYTFGVGVLGILLCALLARSGAAVTIAFLLVHSVIQCWGGIRLFDWAISQPVRGAASKTAVSKEVDQ